MTSSDTPGIGGRKPISEILVLAHSHLDVGYTHSQPLMWNFQVEYIDEALDWLEDTADMPDGARPKWTCEVTEPVERWFAQASSTDIARFKALYDEGRIGIGALRWNTAALADRKGLNRLLDGKKRLEAELGGAITVASQHDVNGIPWPLADELMDNGIDFFVMAINPHLGKAVAPRPGMFMWEAPSGRELRVFNGNHYTMFDQLLYAWDDSVERMQEGWGELHARLTELDYPLDFVYLTSTCSPVLWDNAPPNPFMPPLIQRWNETQAGPGIRYVTYEDLRETAMRVPEAELPHLRGDWTDYWSFGYGSAPRATASNQLSKALVDAGAVLLGGAEHTQLDLAREKIDLYDEHTWGYFDGNPAHPQAQASEAMKDVAAFEGEEAAAFAVLDALERLAGNPPADKGIKGVLLANPAPYPVAIQPVLPDAWFADSDNAIGRTYRASRMHYQGRSWGHEFPGDSGRAFASVTLPPQSWKSIALGDLVPVADTSPVLSHTITTTSQRGRELNFATETVRSKQTGTIVSPFFELTYETGSGRILSVRDVVRDRHLLAPRRGIDLFSFVRERPDPLVDGTRQAYYRRDLDKEKVDQSCWVEEWDPIHESATRVTSCTVSESAGSITLTRRFDAPGVVALAQRITLHADDPTLDIEVTMELEPETAPQAIYFAVPLALAGGWRAGFDTAGQFVGLDEDQLPGACRNWATAETMAVMWDDAGGVALFLPDAPGVQFGDFGFKKPMDAVPRDADPLLLAWPVNNYWDTNFAQQQTGSNTFRYGLRSFAEMDAVALSEQSHHFRMPGLVWPITTGGIEPGEGRLQDRAV